MYITGRILFNFNCLTELGDDCIPNFIHWWPRLDWLMWHPSITDIFSNCSYYCLAAWLSTEGLWIDRLFKVSRQQREGKSGELEGATSTILALHFPLRLLHWLLEIQITTILRVLILRHLFQIQGRDEAEEGMEGDSANVPLLEQETRIRQGL